MGNFANTLFSTLLGWLRGTASMLWNFFSHPEGGGLIVWIADHWLTLIILLCAVCMLLDFIVYLFRWQPYKVWASFFRRLLGRHDEEDDTGRIRRRWVHADGTTSVEVVDASEVEAEAVLEPQAFPLQADADTMPDAYARFARPETLPDLDFREEEPPETTERPPRPEERRRRFAPAQEELPLRYAPPPSASEEPPAYHEAYYPPQWKRPADTGASGIPAGGDGQ